MPQTEIKIINSKSEFTPDEIHLPTSFFVEDSVQITASGEQIQGCPAPITQGPNAGRYISKPLEDSAAFSVLESTDLAKLSSSDMEKLWPIFFSAVKQHIVEQIPIADYQSRGASFSAILQTDTIVSAAYVGDSELFTVAIERPEDSLPIVNVTRLTKFLHHTSDSSEQERLMKEGGKLVELSNGSHRLLIPDKPKAPLALSRAICNAPEKPHPDTIPGLSAIPTVATFDLKPTQQETFIIACSDGFVEYLGGEEACLAKLQKYFSELAQKTTPFDSEKVDISAELMELKDPQWKQGPRDDTTVLCISITKLTGKKNNCAILATVADEYGGTNSVALEITRRAPSILARIIGANISSTAVLDKSVIPEEPSQEQTPPLTPPLPILTAASSSLHFNTKFKPKKSKHHMPHKHRYGKEKHPTTKRRRKKETGALSSKAISLLFKSSEVNSVSDQPAQKRPKNKQDETTTETPGFKKT